MKKILTNATSPFGTVDAAIEVAFDNRQRFDDDEELDNLSIHIAYEDAIHAHGWTVADYEYVFNRAPEGAEEVDNGSDCTQQDEVEDSDYHADDALDYSEEAGG